MHSDDGKVTPITNGQPPQGHHTTRGSILRNMFVYTATVLTLVGIVGVLALALVGIYKTIEWMMTL